jgi:hypothetical protein
MLQKTEGAIKIGQSRNSVTTLGIQDNQETLWQH